MSSMQPQGEEHMGKQGIRKICSYIHTRLLSLSLWPRLWIFSMVSFQLGLSQSQRQRRRRRRLCRCIKCTKKTVQYTTKHRASKSPSIHTTQHNTPANNPIPSKEQKRQPDLENKNPLQIFSLFFTQHMILACSMLYERI